MENSVELPVTDDQGQGVPDVLKESDGVFDLELEQDFLPNVEPIPAIPLATVEQG
ncbi:hypothetical protein [Curtobacterium sp. MCBD17_003]|uniref:hypothetical protein n=1 Tax=Curtobacterium sp. MCBD17_003 TaxID=2175667 RepID=UPI0015E8CA3A|nr:hypothetical protein [Curtobacterium sp. MCBD17_003]WIE54240.1 hypothetical protein DEI88_014115 [Curtobacterium sp. MCBD17_003]